jgi:hypothetical protein
MTPLDRYREPQPVELGEVTVVGKGRPLRLTGARGWHLRCATGCAWVTAPGEPRDIYLLAGDGWDVRSNGLILVEAAADTTTSIRVDRPRHRRWRDLASPAWRRLIHWLAPNARTRST